MAGVSSIVVRAARDHDAKDVLALLSTEPVEVAFDPAEFVVADADGAIVACARLKALPNGTHEIASVVVAREHRGEGLGERVVREALARATGTVYALALAPGFFERQGFARVATLPPELDEKSNGACASSGFVAMAWSPTGEVAVEQIRRRYAEAARTDTCCTGFDCCEQGAYSEEELAALPDGAYLGLGTGNPVREAALEEGDIVLDLGSGAGAGRAP